MDSTSNTNNSNGSILDIILEKSSNIEQSSNRDSIRTALEEAIKVHAKREKVLRQSTITLKSDDHFKVAEASELIEKKWTEESKQAPATYWADKEFIYVQFISPTVKNQFLDFAISALDNDFKERIQRPSKSGEHIQRRPIRVEIANVRANIKTDKVLAILNSILKDKTHKLDNMREGKPNLQKNRSILFSINAEAFKTLFGLLDGALPYVNTATGTKTRLFMKVNCRPWTCRDCFTIGNHQCEGKLCAQCGTKGHLTKECKQKTKFCSNCKKRGHRAKDTHCPTYLNEIGKEIRKMDFPIEYFEEKESRFGLIKHLQLK